MSNRLSIPTPPPPGYRFGEELKKSQKPFGAESGLRLDPTKQMGILNGATTGSLGLPKKMGPTLASLAATCNIKPAKDPTAELARGSNAPTPEEVSKDRSRGGF